MDKQKCYSKGKFFDCLDELIEYEKIWPSSPADLEEYRRFLDQRFEEAKLNLEMNPSFSNRDVFFLLRMNTEWVVNDS